MKSVARVNYLGEAGIVQSVSQGAWDFIYRTSTVKDPKWNIGDRVELPDGRGFRYGKSAGECVSGLGCRFMAAGFSNYTVADVAQVIGDKEITIPDAATHDEVAENELAGGYVVLYGASENIQFRGIVGNAAAVADAPVKVYLDGPLTAAVVVSTTGVESFQNPYASLLTAGTVNKAVAGCPATQVSDADTYFWVQVTGPCWVSPRGGVNDRDQGCYWTHEGQIKDTEASLGAITLPVTNTSQYAGHTILGNEDTIGPLFMLKG